MIKLLEPCSPAGHECKSHIQLHLCHSLELKNRLHLTREVSFSYHGKSPLTDPSSMNSSHFPCHLIHHTKRPPCDITTLSTKAGLLNFNLPHSIYILPIFPKSVAGNNIPKQASVPRFPHLGL